MISEPLSPSHELRAGVDYLEVTSPPELAALVARVMHEPEVFADYLRCFVNPETIRATCDEYRAGAGIDLEHDRADRARKIAMPLLVLWGRSSGQGSGYDMLSVWRDHAENVRGQAIDSGHFLPEDAADNTYAALRDFFNEGG